MICPCHLAVKPAQSTTDRHLRIGSKKENYSSGEVERKFQQALIPIALEID
jgi:hypothetical protein